MIGRIAKRLKGEVGQCCGCFTTVFSDEDYVMYRGGVFCADCALYQLEKKRPARDRHRTGRRSEDEQTPRRDREG